MKNLIKEEIFRIQELMGYPKKVIVNEQLYRIFNELLSNLNKGDVFLDDFAKLIGKSGDELHDALKSGDDILTFLGKNEDEFVSLVRTNDTLMNFFKQNFMKSPEASNLFDTTMSTLRTVDNKKGIGNRDALKSYLQTLIANTEDDAVKMVRQNMLDNIDDTFAKLKGAQPTDISKMEITDLLKNDKKYKNWFSKNESKFMAYVSQNQIDLSSIESAESSLVRVIEKDLINAKKLNDAKREKNLNQLLGGIKYGQEISDTLLNSKTIKLVIVILIIFCLMTGYTLYDGWKLFQKETGADKAVEDVIEKLQDIGPEEDKKEEGGTEDKKEEGGTEDKKEKVFKPGEGALD